MDFLRHFSPAARERIIEYLSPTSLLHLTSCSRSLYESNLVLSEARKKLPAYFILYDLSKEMKDTLPNIDARVLFNKACMMQTRESASILSGLPFDVKGIWSVEPRGEQDFPTLEGLVQQLTATEPQEDGIKLITTVLRTFPCYTSFEKLLALIFERYNVPEYGHKHQDLQGDVKTYEDNKKKIQLRVMNLLRRIAMQIGEYFLYVPDNGKLLLKFLKFLDEVKGEYIVRLAQLIKISLVKRSLCEVTLKYRVPASCIDASKLSSNKTIHDFTAKELAHQIINLFYELSQSTKMLEFLKMGWASPENTASAGSAPNLRRDIQLANKVTDWVQAEIVSESDIKQRVKIYEKFIFMVEEMFKCKAFHTAIAVSSGWTAVSVHRLQHTFEGLSGKAKKVKENAEDILSNKHSFKRLRHEFIQAVPPVLPPLSIFLTDLTFMEEGNPDFSGRGINIRKYHMISQVLGEMDRYKIIPFNFEPNASARDFLLCQFSKEHDWKQFYEQSLIAEPKAGGTIKK